MKNLKHFQFIFIPALIAVLLIAWTCKENVSEPYDTSNSISGQILDEQDIPVPGAIIQVFSSSSGIQGLIDKDTTDEDGYFNLSRLPDNLENLDIRIDHDDFETLETPLMNLIQNKDRKKLGVKLQHDSICTGIIEISIVDINNQPLENVEVRLNRQEKKIRKALTNEYGVLVFENVCPGEYWIRLAKDGYKVIEEDFFIEQGDTIPLNFEMIYSEDDTCCRGIINYTILDSLEGTPISNVKVRLWSGSKKIRESLTNDNGKVTFERICDGEFQISYLKEGYYGQEFNFSMECSDTVDFTRYMMQKIIDDSCCNGIIHLLVKDSTTNTAIKNVAVKLWKNGKVIKTGQTSESGLISFNNLCQGKYGFSLHHQLYKTIEFNLELGCNDTLELHKTMIKMLGDSCCDGSIELTVLDKITGEGINDAKIKLWKNGKILKSGFTEDGFIKFEDLCEGTYWIDIITDKYKDIEFEVEVPCNKTVKLTKKLEQASEKDSCCDGRVVIIPKDAETKVTIKGAVVKLWKDGKVIGEKKVEGDAAVFEGLCEGKYAVDIMHEHYKNIEFVFELGCNGNKEIIKHLENSEDDCCNGVIYLVVKDSLTNAGINHLTVRLWKGGNKVAEGKTNDNGLIKFYNVCEGHYAIDLLKEGYYSHEFGFEVDCNDTLEMHKKMLPRKDQDTCHTAEIQLLVKDAETKEHLAGATVWIYDGDNLIYEGKTNENGWFIYGHLSVPPGRYKFKAWIEGYHDNHTIVEWDECKEKEAALMLEKME